MSGESGARRAVERLEHALTRLAWLQRRMLLQELGPHGLTVPQFIVLDQIARYHAGDQMSMGEIAGMAQQCGPTVTGIVGRLVRMGYLTRSRAKDDRRHVLACLTDEGKRAWQQLTTSRNEALERRLTLLGPQDTVEVLRLVEKYLQLIESELGEGGDEESL